MRREAKLLLDKACDALLLSIELFNRPHDRGRITGTLVLLDHSFEMLLKAGLVHKGRQIRERGGRETFGFDACIRKALSDKKTKFLTNEQALSLQAINGLRDAAQHHLLNISEGQLYMHAQTGVTLFRDLLKMVFGRELVEFVPPRVLPISTLPPSDLTSLFDQETQEVAKLLRPGSRKGLEARAKLRPLAILDATVRGQKGQPSKNELNQIGDSLLSGKNWRDLFPGAASIEISAGLTTGGMSLSLRLSKKDGIPVHLVPEGTPGASVVAIKRVDDLGFYNLGRDQVAQKVGLSGPKTTALMRYLDLEADKDCFKLVRISQSEFRRFSQKAIEKLQVALKTVDMDDVWKKHGNVRVIMASK